MDFLVKGQLNVPASISPEELEAKKAGEIARGAELAANGTFLRQWRVPGRRAVWGLWRTADATELQSILETLPMYPFFELEIHALADHPRDPGDSAMKTARSGASA